MIEPLPATPTTPAPAKAHLTPPATEPLSPTPTPSEVKKPKPLAADHFRIPRWAAAFLLLAGCVAGLMGTKFHTCKEETAKKGAELTETRTCTPPTVSDAGVVAVGLLLILLIVPDMSEVGVFGISLKRRLQAAEQKAAESKATADVLETRMQVQNSRIDTLSQNLANANAQAVNNVYLVTGEELKQQTEQLQEKAQAFRRGEDSIPTTTDTLAEMSETLADPELAVKLIYNYETIMGSLGITDYHPIGVGPIPLYRISREDHERFMTLFGSELETIRAARNNVAHAKPIPADDLRRAVQLSDDLVEILKNSPSRGGA